MIHFRGALLLCRCLAFHDISFDCATPSFIDTTTPLFRLTDILHHPQAEKADTFFPDEAAMAFFLMLLLLL